MRYIKSYLLPFILFVITVVYSYLSLTCDVTSSGLDSTLLGFSSFNLACKLNFNSTCYLISEILGYICILFCSVFFFIGLIQWIKRKNIFKVDYNILSLGVVYLTIFIIFMIFLLKDIGINYRPYLIDGEMEPSFPSSHTLLACTIILSGALNLKYYVKNIKLRKILVIIFIILAVLTTLFRFLSGAHWISDIIVSELISLTLVSAYYITNKLFNKSGGNKMKVVVNNEKELSRLIAEDFIKVVNDKNDAVLGLATGTSPLGVYSNLAKANKEGRVSFKNCKSFNLDEYVGLEGTHNQSYRYFMNENLFNHIDIDKKNTNVLLGVGDYISFMNKYDDMIKQAGGIDIQILGIGSDGHIAFNEPNTSFESLTHETELTEQTIKDNSRLFNDISEVPTRAVTMGLKSIMNAKKIVLIATGKNKAKAVYGLLKGPIDESMPCSILQKHNDVTVYVDEDAYSLCK